LLYVFSAEVGDTIPVSIGNQYYYYSDTIMNIVIDSISFEVYGNDTIKFFYNTSLHQDLYFFNDVYRTRIGADYFFPFPRVTIPEYDILHCYEDENINLNFYDVPCDSVHTNIIDYYLNDISIYPNPSSDILNIKSLEEINYTIFDLKGSKILYGESQNQITIIDVSNLNAGLYILSLENVGFYKFIVE